MVYPLSDVSWRTVRRLAVLETQFGGVVIQIIIRAVFLSACFNGLFCLPSVSYVKGRPGDP